MANTCLDFEKPIFELEKKLAEWQEFSAVNDMDVSEEMDSLQKKIQELMKKTYTHLTPWQRVQLARHSKRPYTLDYVGKIFTDFLELHGDRRYSDDAAIVGEVASEIGHEQTADSPIDPSRLCSLAHCRLTRNQLIDDDFYQPGWNEIQQGGENGKKQGQGDLFRIWFQIAQYTQQRFHKYLEPES